MIVKVHYQIATYSGVELVSCDPDDDSEVIVAKAKKQLKQKTGDLPFGYQNFAIERE